jgi:hypothetical protein
MKKIAAPCALAGLLAFPCLAPAQSGTYRAEAELFYSRISGDNSRSRGIDLQGTYYFADLPKQPDYPLEAAPFVERIGSVSLDYSRSSTDTDGFQALEDDSGFGLNLVLRHPNTPFFAAVSYDRSYGGKVRSPTGTEFDSEGDAYALAVGAYVAKRTLVTLAWRKSENDTTNYLNSGNVVLSSTDTSISAGIAHLAQLPGGTHLGLSAAIAQAERDSASSSPDRSNSVSLTGTYYPTTRLGLNAGIVYDRGDEFFSGNTYSAGISWFATPAVRLSFDVLRIDREERSDFGGVFLGATLRF